MSYRVHLRIASAMCSVAKPRMRSFLETALFVGAVVQLAILVGLHYIYISAQLKDSNLIAQATAKVLSISNNMTLSAPSFVPASSNCLLHALREHPALSSPKRKYLTVAEVLEDFPLIQIRITDGGGNGGGGDPSCSADEPVAAAIPSRNGRSRGEANIRTTRAMLSVSPRAFPVYLYSFERGHLFINSDFRSVHGIQRLDLNIPMNATCFGPPLAAWILQEFVGYDSVLVHMGLGAFGQRGYLYNSFSRQLFSLKLSTPTIVVGNPREDRAQGGGVSGGSGARRPGSGKTESRVRFPEEDLHLAPFSLQAASFKIGVFVTAVFLFFATSTLVSFTLRETQARMLRFTFLLQYHIQNRLSYKILILNQISESLVFVPVMVGMLFFLGEFFGDQLLAFILLSLVWCGEVYAVICVRTAPSLRVFPRLYVLFMTLYLVYVFHYPCGFTYMALYTTFLFVLHCMFHFFHRFELPALASGTVNATSPRAGLVFVPDGAPALLPSPPLQHPRLHQQEQRQRQQQHHTSNQASPQRSARSLHESALGAELVAGGSDSLDSFDDGASEWASSSQAGRGRNNSVDSDIASTGRAERAAANQARFDQRERSTPQRRRTSSSGSGSGSVSGVGGSLGLTPEAARRQRAANELLLLRSSSAAAGSLASAGLGLSILAGGASSPSPAEGNNSFPQPLSLEQSLEQSRLIQRQQWASILHGYSNAVQPLGQDQGSSPPPPPPASASTSVGASVRRDLSLESVGAASRGSVPLPRPLPLGATDVALRPSRSFTSLIWGLGGDDE